VIVDEDPVLSGGVLELPGERFFCRCKREVVGLVVGDKQPFLTV
jgi:hypothetical protein